jgi:DEAD/DEAH box helicase domain-containing protein
VSRYRCPKCKLPNSIDINKVHDGRLTIVCSGCGTCALVPSTSNLDEAYLEFLSMYDSGHITDVESLKSMMEHERLLRPTSEIDAMILRNNANDNEMLKGILRSQKDYVVDYEVIQEPEPEHGIEVKHLPIDDAIIDALIEIQINKLYKFQEEAVKTFLGGKDVVVVAPTASGKTEAFCIPILQKIFEELSLLRSAKSKIKGKRKIFAIIVYPTKALARDQLAKIKQLGEPLGIYANIFDGDTTREQRDSILSSPPEIIITNFDVLHYHLLNRTKFSYLITDAGFLVIDEAHIYTGIFGANVHYIIRRLERMSRNRKLQIIAASATLPNAEDFCMSLFGRKMNIVYGKGRRGKINFIILFPSLRSRRSLMIDLVRQMTTNNHKTIAFNKSHLGSELLAFYLSKQGLKVKVHRAGLLPIERKIVERSFINGKLMAISATPTLELGIDVGDVDAIVSDIVPVNRLVQRVGRAARSGQEGYAFLALGNDPISQYYKSHPCDYMADQEMAYTDPSNPFVEEHQVLAMACDRPILVTESVTISHIIERLTSKGLLHMSNGKFLPDFNKAMSILRDFSIRGIGGGTDIFFSGKLVAERSLPQALEELHDNAIYFISGKRYQVKKLHFDPKNERRSYAELIRIPDNYPYYTKSILDEMPTVLSTYEYKRAFGIEVKYCSLKIQKRVLGYSNIEIGQEVAKGTKVMFENPIEFQFITKGLVFRAPRPVNTSKNANDKQYVEMSGYHASEHVMIEGSTMITGGASQDLGGISLGSSGLIFIYDGTIGGNGASRVLYDKFENALERSLRILTECSCRSESGCPRCTYSYSCGNNNEYLHKIAAIEVLKRISERQETHVEDVVPMDRTLV